MQGRSNLCDLCGKFPSGRPVILNRLDRARLLRATCGVLSKLLPLAVPGVFIASAAAADLTLHSFKKQHLETHYWSEGAMLGDLNRDGKADAVYGPYWWEGPDFTKRHEIYAPKTTFTIKEADGTGKTLPGFEGGFGRKNAYSTDNFFAFVHDFNGDGWNDVLTYGLPHTPAYLYLNPAGEERHWARHTVLDEVDNESPTFADLTGDGKPEIVCVNGGNFGYASPDWTNPTAKWTFTPISAGGTWQRYTHGLGLGDMNGDGRLDVLFKDGWFEQPASLAGNPAWTLHRFLFAPASAQMFAYDVNGDGLMDVITALAAHGYGFAWYEQLKDKDANGTPQFKPHIFMNKEPRENRYGVTFSEIHAVELVDVDGDGLKDIVTGKCFWAHGPTGAPESNAPAVLYWFKLVRRPDGSVDWVPNLIDDNSGVGRQVGLGDVNNDGRPDIIIGNKKGAFVFTNQARTVARADWERAQPKVQFPNAERNALSVRDIIVHTPRASDVAKAKAAPSAHARPSPDLAPSPPMGWNSWNWHGKKDISEKIVEETIDAMVTHGLRDAGYTYVVVDGGWRDTKLGPNGELRAHPTRFPGGMKRLADYAHARGMKFGLHTAPGTHDCGGDAVGGFGREAVHLRQFVEWGLDLVKVDKCKYEPGWTEEKVKATYATWADLMARSGRPMLLSISAYEYRDWYPAVCHMARTTYDIRSRIHEGGAGFDDPQPRTNHLSVMAIAEQNNRFAGFAGKGYWNDPDMLVTGNQGLTPEEQKAHFALWCVMSSPLMLGNDPRSMTSAEKAILLNRECIAVNQDPTEQGRRVRVDGKTEIWVKKLRGNRAAVLLLNRAAVEAHPITFRADDAGLMGKWKARDLYGKEDLGTFESTLTKSTPPHAGWFMLVSTL